MRLSACVLAALFFIGGYAPAWPQDKTPESPKRLPDGVYAVLRESLKEKDVLPLKEGEVLAVHHSRYVKKNEKEPPRFLVVQCAPDLVLDLAGQPKAVKEGEE